MAGFLLLAALPRDKLQRTDVYRIVCVQCIELQGLRNKLLHLRNETPPIGDFPMVQVGATLL